MRKKSINLLQERGAPPTLWEKAYDWVTNTCRIIVIFTEFLVLGAFGWRFWLDRELNDLKDAIEEKGEIIKALSDDEDEIRTLQDKMTTYTQLWEIGSNYTPVFTEINNYIPSDTDELSFSITKGKEGVFLNIEGVLEREKIDRLENKLKDNKEKYSDVTLSNIGVESGDEWKFLIRGKIIYNLRRQTLSTDETAEPAAEGTL